MSNKKIKWRTVPALVVSGGLLIGAVLKIAGVHPMMPHFTEMGLQPYATGLGYIEIVCISLFLFPKTVKVGLLLLTGYFGGAIAAEMPYHLMYAPALVLLSIWTAAFIRMPQLFLEAKKISFVTVKS